LSAAGQRTVVHPAAGR